MRIKPNETELLIAFARAASKAQEIEALFRDSLIALEVATDIAKEGSGGRSFEDIAGEIDRLPLGVLKEKFFKLIAKDLSDPGVKETFDAVNDERIFLMHNFFQAFPLEKLNSNKDAVIRLERIDGILGTGLGIFRRAHDRALALGKIHPAKLREILKFLVDDRRNAKAPDRLI
jgi:hypothetical protein